MKALFVKSSILLSIAISAVSGQDSLSNLKNVYCTFMNSVKPEEVTENGVEHLILHYKQEEITCLRFAEDDSVFIRSTNDSVYRLRINNLKKLIIYKGNFSITGLLFGAGAGALVGYAGGSSGAYMTPRTKNICAILGACAGGLVGFIIGSLIVESEFLDLTTVNTKDKRSKLIKFLRQK